MRGSPASPPRRALAAAVAIFVALTATLALVQHLDLSTGECEAWAWRPLRALPWLAVVLLPVAVYELVARRRPSSTPPLTVGDGPYRQGVVDAAQAPMTRPRAHRHVRALMAFVGILLGVVASRQAVCPYGLPASCRAVPGASSRIAIVGVGAFDVQLVDDVARHFRDCYGLPVSVGAPFAAPGEAWNTDRNQWVAEGLLAAMESEPDVLTIGITSDDIFTDRESWRYAFGTRNSGRRVAILSTARMRSFAGGVSSELVRKYVARTIAFEYCGLPRVNDPKSVRATSLMGPNDLEAIDESVW